MITMEHTEDRLLALKKLLHSDSWPTCLETEMLPPATPEEMLERARKAISFLVQPQDLDLAKKVLDFGCGTGESVAALHELGIPHAIGYDTIHHPNAVTNFDYIQEVGPYDIIIANDVLDHLLGENMTQAIASMKLLLAEKGKIYLKCHPFCSRAGGHHFHEINKAYVHMFFYQTELEEMGYRGLPTIPVLYPHTTYVNAIQQAGLHIEHEWVVRQDIEEIFKEHPILSQTLKWVYDTDKFPFYQLEQASIEYILTKESDVPEHTPLESDHQSPPSIPHSS